MRQRALLCIFVCVATATSVTTAGAAKRAGKRQVVKPGYDPAAPVVELFDGIDQQKFEARLVPKNSLEGSVFIENRTDKPLTVKLPQAVAAVQVLKQGLGGAAAGGRGGTGQPGGIGGGQGQALGGGFGGGGFGGGGVGGGIGGGAGGVGGGGGFFTIPPEKAVRAPLTSVCLNHGKPEPRPNMSYRLVPLETYTTDPALRALLVAVGSGKLEPGAAQAAAWHLSDAMSWQELAEKKIDHLGGVDPEPYFSETQLAAAREIAAAAKAAASEQQSSAESGPAPVRERKRRSRS